MWSIAACYAPILGLERGGPVCCPLPLAEGLTQQVGVIGVVAVGATGWVASRDRDRADSSTDLVEQRRHVPRRHAQPRSRTCCGRPTGSQVAAPDLRTCLVAGSSGVTALREAFEDTFGVRLLDSYMTTETTGPVTVELAVRWAARTPRAGCRSPASACA